VDFERFVLRIPLEQRETSGLFESLREFQTAAVPSAEIVSQLLRAIGENFFWNGIGREKGTQTKQIRGRGAVAGHLGESQRKSHCHRRMIAQAAALG
jgi:hypothetical protein